MGVNCRIRKKNQFFYFRPRAIDYPLIKERSFPEFFLYLRMRKFLLALTILLALVASFIFYTFYTTGYFRDVPAKSEIGKVYKSIDLPGVEDMALAREDSLLLLSVNDRASRRVGKEGVHGIYLVDLRA
jgi:hypothetical protein